jgi:hypothetical protein
LITSNTGAGWGLRAATARRPFRCCQSPVLENVIALRIVPHLSAASPYQLLELLELFAICLAEMNRSRVNLAGLIVLVIGLAIAEGIYWIGGQAAAGDAKSQQSRELASAMQLENQRKSDREIEMGFGKVYVMVIHAEQWWMSLSGYQQAAFVILAITVLTALSCFILAAQLRL